MDAVAAVLRSDRLTQGPALVDFEESLAGKVEAKHAVAFTSGTAALHGAVMVAGLGPGDTVATSPLSFAASASCARYAGAAVRFVDIDPKTLHVDPRRLPIDVTGWVVVHYAGLPVDLALAADRPRVVIEDAAHALGASTPDGPVGNCARSDMCVFSFHPVKAITTGEGGAVTTNSRELADRLRRFRNHGIARRPELGGWYYEITELAFNYRMTDIQAALGTSQLRRLDSFVDRRNWLADRYRDLLSGLPITLPPAAPNGHRHAYHLFPVRLADRRNIYDRLQNAGIGVQVHYVPIYRHPLYAATASPTDFPETEKAYSGLLSLPLYPDLSEHDQKRVVDVLRSCL